MAYVRPTNAAALSPEAKNVLLKKYGDFYRELAAGNPGELNKKLPRSALEGALDRLGAVIVEEAKILATSNAEVRRFLDENRLPDMMRGLLPDDFRAFCLLLNGLKQWLSAEQAATDRYLLGGTARGRCKAMLSSCVVTGTPLTGDIELHHPVRDGRPPIPLSKEMHRTIERPTISSETSGDVERKKVARLIEELKKPNESWRMLRRGCRLILGLSPGGGTVASNASAKALARRAINKTKLPPQELLDWMDAEGLGLNLAT
jgi:hypothetical protein